MIDVRPSQDTRDLRPSASLNSQANDPVPFIVYPRLSPLSSPLISISFRRRSSAISSGTACKPLCNFSNLSPRVHPSPYRIFRINFPNSRQNFQVSRRRFFHRNYFVDKNDVWLMLGVKEEFCIVNNGKIIPSFLIKKIFAQKWHR